MPADSLIACVGDNCLDIPLTRDGDRVNRVDLAEGVTASDAHNGAAAHNRADARNRADAHDGADAHNGAAGHGRTETETAEGLPGGNAYNVAVELAQEGRRAAYLGAVGDDRAGSVLVSAAAAAGVDVTRVAELPGGTGRTLIGHDAYGERRFVHEDYGVSADYRLDADTVSWLARAHWVHFSRQPDLAEWGPRLRAQGALISCDLGYEGGIDELELLAPMLDVAFLSFSAAAGLSSDEILARALRAGVPLVVLTLGVAGSTAATQGQRWHADAVPVPQVVDTLGAGDAYIAAFIAELSDHNNVPAAMRAGSHAGAAACTQWGPVASKWMQPGRALGSADNHNHRGRSVNEL